MTYMINENGVDREMTKAEEKEFEASRQEQINEAKLKAEIAEAKQIAKSALLERLGITAEEVKLLMS